MKDVFDHIDGNLEARIEQLNQWLRIPSVSADPAFKDDCREAAGWLVEQLNAAGMEKTEVVETGGHPAVYGETDGALLRPLRRAAGGEGGRLGH